MWGAGWAHTAQGGLFGSASVLGPLPRQGCPRPPVSHRGPGTGASGLAPSPQPDGMTWGLVSRGPRKDSGGSGCQRVGRHGIPAAQDRGVGEVGPECSMGKGRRKTRAEADSEGLSGASCPPLFGQKTKGGARAAGTSSCHLPPALSLRPEGEEEPTLSFEIVSKCGTFVWQS